MNDNANGREDLGSRLMLCKLSDQSHCMQAGEKLALKDTTKGDVIVKLVPLIDNFEAAKNSIKVQTDAEQKIVDSYQVGDAEHELGSMWTGACGMFAITLTNCCCTILGNECFSTQLL